MKKHGFEDYLIKETDFYTELNALLYNTDYQVPEDDYTYLSNRNHQARATATYNGREFVVRTVSSHWTVEEAAQMVTELQDAVNLASHINALVKRYENHFDAQNEA